MVSFRGGAEVTTTKSEHQPPFLSPMVFFCPFAQANFADVVFVQATCLRVATSRPTSCHCFHLQVFNVWFKHVKLKTEKESMEMRQEAYD